MKILVQHVNFNETTGNPEGFTDVAEVDVSSMSELSRMDQLEYAYRWTNNVMGSWSRSDIEDNGDFNPKVTRLAPLPVYNGKTFGLRSTSVGDRMTINGCTYKVGAFGFELVELEAA